MNNYTKENNPVLKLTFEFTLEIINYCSKLDELKKYPLSNQLFKCGTSIGANASEAQHAESKADFIHKFKIAAKEMNETAYWLSLCKHSNHFPDCDHLIARLDEIQRVINKIISTSKRAS
ncbi:MAG: four helix bundle protein [Chitinophagales bacterium]